MHVLLVAICDCLIALPRLNDEAPACREMRRYTADELDPTTSVKTTEVVSCLNRFVTSEIVEFCAFGGNFQTE
jgi:hypothetical protein